MICLSFVLVAGWLGLLPRHALLLGSLLAVGVMYLALDAWHARRAPLWAWQREVRAARTWVHSIRLAITRQQQLYPSQFKLSAPWIVLLGPSGVGKSTMLHSAGLLPLGDEKTPLVAWLAANAVFIAPPRDCIPGSAIEKQWHAIMEVLRDQLAAVVLLIDVNIMSGLDDPAVQATQELRRVLDGMATYLPLSYPTYLIIGKADLLPWFNEFASSLSPEERDGPWGFGLPQTAHLELLRKHIEEQLQAMASSLAARAVVQVLGTQSRRQQEAALGLPILIPKLGPRLELVVTGLFADGEIDLGPELCGVFLASSKPECGSTLVSRGWLRTVLGPDLPYKKALLPLSGAYFVRGLFRQISNEVWQEHTARQTERRSRQLLAVAVAMVMCVVGGWALTAAYRDDIIWLERAGKAVDVIFDTPITESDAASERDFSLEKLDKEIHAQAELLDLIENAPPGLLSSVRHRASRLLRKSIHRQWIVPLRPMFREDLNTIVKVQRNRAQMAAGIRTVQALYILSQPVGLDVGGARRQWLIEYLMSAWAQAAERSLRPMDARLLAILRRLIEFHFLAVPAGEDGPPSLLPEPMLEEARHSLAMLSPDIDLLAASAGISRKTAMLKSSAFVDHGIDELYTPTGCSSFFSESVAGNAQRWWQEVLRTSTGTISPITQEQLSAQYRDHFRAAWGHWLQEVSWPSELGQTHGNRIQSIENVVKMLDKLALSPRGGLSEILGLLGGGSTGPEGIFELPVCRNARLEFAGFWQASNSSQMEGYFKATRELRDSLVDHHAIADQLVAATQGTGDFYRAIIRVGQARRDFIAALPASFSRSRDMHLTDIIDRRLETVERDAWSALQHEAKSQIEHQWSELRAEWLARFSANASNDDWISICMDAHSFLKERVASFNKRYFLPLIEGQELRNCLPARLSAPLASLEITPAPAACTELRQALGAALLPCSLAAVPPSPAGASGVATKVDARNGLGCKRLESVEVDPGRGQKRSVCSISTGRCVLREGGEGPASLVVSWQGGPRETMLKFTTFQELIARGRHSPDGRMLFDISHKSDMCSLAISFNHLAERPAPVLAPALSLLLPERLFN